ncbi:MAG: FG-GAP-like repeat-containing protein [Elusimicrobia bacterium]|nr:FG-GAP-like repeat-containing protein [Elusimicrobiota bacterium]
MGRIMKWCMMSAVVMIGLSAVSQSAINPGDIFKEKYIWSTPPAKNYSNAWWRVTDPNPSYPNGPLEYDAPQDFLPNYIQYFSGLDLVGATRAEIVVEMWGGHIGTSNKQFKVNNNAWIPVPENTDISNPECYLNFRYPVAAIPISQLTSGTNAIEFTAGPQICGSFGWGQWAYYGLKLRIYYDSTKTHPTGSITSPAASSTINDNPTISAAVNTYTGGINHVDFIGYYDDFDEDGNGIYSQWHYMYVLRNGALTGHIGTVTSAPYTKTWDTTWVPDQAASSIKFMAVIAGNDGMCYATSEVAGITLSRNVSVKMYKPSNVPQGFTVMSGSLSCNIIVPSNASPVTGARISVVTWNGAAGTTTQSVTFGGTEICTAFPNAADHDYGYSNITVPASVISAGTKQFTLTANSGGQHGPEVIWPGPVLFVQYNTGGMQTVADPSINPNGGTFSSAQPVSITCATTGVTIKYTTDGSDPSPTNGTVYSSQITMSSNATLKAMAYKTGMLNSNVVTAAFTITVPTMGDPLYYVPVTVAVGSYPRYDKPVEVTVNFTQYLTALSVSGSLNDQSLRVKETDSTGNTVINDNVLFQFDKDTAYNASNNAIGTVIFIMDGTTNASATRYFKIFFDIDQTITKVNFTNQVTLTDNVEDEGQSSYQIQSANATYYYHKQGGGFSSMVDNQGNDWLGYHASGGSAGSYRGIPNMVYPASYFHPGFVNSNSSILSQGPVKVKYKTESIDGLWACTWEIFPKYARMTVTKKNSAYWFLYEGTPGGNLDVTGTQDYFYRSNDTSPQLCGSYPSTNILNADIPSPEWVYFADGTINRSIYLINHQDDTANDSYYQMENNMTVFGFGRTGTTSSLNPVVPAYYTIGFADSRDLATTKNTIESSWRDLTKTIGTPGKAAPSNKVATPQFSKGTGTYTSSQSIVITCGTSGATIKYTTDGSVPSTSGTATSGTSPLTVIVSQTLTLRAVAVKSGMDNSYENSAAYTINTGSGGTLSFTEVVVDANNPMAPHGKEIADIDKDGLNDLIVAGGAGVSSANQSQTGLYWYKAPTWEKKFVARDGAYTTDVAVGDVDNDGYVDIIVPMSSVSGWGSTSDTIVWYKNPGANVGSAANWGAPRVIGTNMRGHDVEVADLDNDGNLDVIARGQSSWGQAQGNIFRIWKNNGNGASWTQKEITGLPSGEGIKIGLINNDNLKDIAIAGSWFKNPGDIINGTWTKYTYATVGSYNDPNGGGVVCDYVVDINDFNKDGRNDIVISPSENSGDFAWYEAPANPENTNWVIHTLGTGKTRMHSLRTADFNKDGYVDIATAKMDLENNGGDPVEVYLNDKTGNFPAANIKQISTGGSHDIAIGDIDNDGDIDIMGANCYDEQAADSAVIKIWRASITGGSSGPVSWDKWTYKQLDNSRVRYGSWEEWFGLDAADLTGDGKKDIVSGRYFYRNPGGDMMANWTRTDFNTTPLNANVDACIITDVDGDANGDVIANGLSSSYTSPAGVYWLEKTGTGDTSADWTKTLVVSNSIIGPTAHALAQGFGHAQIIPGGKEEILVIGDNNGVAYKWAGTIYLIQIPSVNPQNGNWKTTPISAKFGCNGQSLAIGDIDGDGDLDVAGVNENDNTIVWWENPYTASNPSSVESVWTRHDVGPATPVDHMYGSDGPDRIKIADLDGDGRPDIVVTDEIWCADNGANPLRTGSRTYWFKNPADPKGLWGTANVIQQNQQSTNSLGVADMDNDGDIDVITGKLVGDMELAVWENNGTGVFTKHSISTGYESHNGAQPFDLDGDGDLDIVSICWNDYPKMHIWRNDNTSSGNPPPVVNNPPTVSISNIAVTNGSNPPATVVISATASDSDGTISKVEFYNGTTLLGTATSSPYSYTWNNVFAGTYSITAKATDNSNAATTTSAQTVTITGGTVPPSTQQAYPGGVAWQIVSGTTTIQAEDYDMVTSGTASGESYNDTTVGNSGGAYRTTENVDIEACTDTGNGYDVGWAIPGEWLEYSINVNQAGEYKIVLRAANGLATTGSPIHLEFGQHKATPYLVTPSVSVPATGGWQTWTDVTVSNSVTLTAGAQIMKLVLDNSAGEAAGNFNYIKLVSINSTPPPSTNIVSNPGFETGTAPWGYYAGGGGSFTTSTPGYTGSNAAKCTVTAANSNIQFFQSGIVLDPNTKYRLTFSAYSVSGHDLSVNLCKHDSPYTAYGLSYTANLGTTWQTFTTEFNTTGFSSKVSDGRLYFWLASFAAAGDVYYIDDVRLETVNPSNPPADTTAPSIAITSPANNTTITVPLLTLSGTASDNIGLSKVELKVGTAGTYTAVSGTLSPWSGSVTLTNGSNTVYAKATDTSGNIKEATITVTYTPTINIISNPGFETGTTPWAYYAGGGGALTTSTPGYTGTNAGKCTITSANANIQLYQSGIVLDPNTRYRLTFSAYSTSGHDVTVNLLKHVSPYTGYGLNYTANLGTTWQTFTTEFNTTGFTSKVSDGRLQFWFASFAASGDVYYIDDVRLETVPITVQTVVQSYNVGGTVAGAPKMGVVSSTNLKFKVQVYSIDKNDIAADYDGTLTLTTMNSNNTVLDTVDTILTKSDSGETELSVPYNRNTETIELSGNSASPVMIKFSDLYVAKLVGTKGGTIEGINGIKMVIPSGVLSADKYIAAIRTKAPPAVKNTIRYVNTVNPISYDFGELSFSKNAPVMRAQTFTKTVSITIPWTAADIGTLNEDGLRIYCWNGTDWDLVPGVQAIDKTNKTITATVKHFSTYRILGSYLSADFSNLKVYPNPYNPATAIGGKLKIINLPVSSVVKLYSVTGELVRELKEIDFGNLGWLEWDGKNDDGDKVGKAVYIYQIEDAAGKKKTGKIGLIK